MPLPHPNKMGHNVVMTGRRDSSFHFVSFGMTGSFEENVGAGRLCRPAPTPVKLAIVIPRENPFSIVTMW